MNMAGTECEECGRPATERTIAGRRFALCDRCNDRLLVQIALDDRILEIVKLSKINPSEAIRILDDIQNNYRDIDHDGWLDRSIRSQRALIFMQHGRHKDALAELRAIERCLKEGSEAFAENKHSIANVLACSGKPREAIHEIELALDSREHLPMETLVGLLTAYARIASKQGWTIPAGYQSTFERAVREWGMLVSSEFVSSDLTQAILLAASQRLAAQDRYVALLEELRGKPSDVRARLLREFIEAEPVGYFRDQARRSLDGGEAPEGMEQEEG